MLSIENDLDIITLSDDENITELTDNNELEVAIYTCTASGILPSFNSGFTYTHNEVDNGDGTYTTTIIADSLDNLPTGIGFSGLFDTDRYTHLVRVDKVNTSNMTSMDSMFRDCRALTYVDVSNFDTSKVTKMGAMFRACIKLETIKGLDSFDTSKVTDMGHMFQECRLLTEIDVSSFDTSKVTLMNNMFNECRALTSLDVSSWDTNKVTNISSMFSNCIKLGSIDVSNWNTSSVTNMQGAFYNCNSLTSIDVSRWNTSSVTNMNSVFFGCYLLTSIDVSNWDTSSVTTMEYMFYMCHNLTSLDVSEWDTGKVTSMRSMFQACRVLSILDLSSFDTNQVTVMSSMFQNCYALTSLDLSNWNTSNVTLMSNMFSSCSELTSLEVRHFNMSKVTNMYAMFNGCSKLTSLDLSGWNVCKLTSIDAVFYNCYNLASIDLSNWNTESLTDMSSSFCNCRSLTEIDFSTWNTSKVNNLALMFMGCTNLRKVNMSTDYSNVTNPARIFEGCTSLEDIEPPKNIKITHNINTDIPKKVIGKWINGLANVTDGQTITLTTNTLSELTALEEGMAILKGWTILNCTEPIIIYKDTALGTSDDSYAKELVIELTSANYLTRLDEVLQYYPNCTDIYLFGDDTLTTLSLMFNKGNLTYKSQIKRVGFVGGYMKFGIADVFHSLSSVEVIDLTYWDSATYGRGFWGTFNGCAKLTTILGVENLVTSSCTEVSLMFYACKSLATLDVSNWNTSNVTSMQRTFDNCTSLSTLDLESWNTSKVTNMSNMFRDCWSLTTLDLSNWDMSKVTNKSSVFSNCRTLHSITCNNLNTIIALSDELPTRTSDSQGEIVTEVHKKMSADLKATLSSKYWTVTELPYVVLKYKFNHKLYADLLPALNPSFNDYTILDEVNNKDGVTIRSIKSLSPPTSIRFGTANNTIQDQQKCLLEVLDLDTSEVTNMNNMFSYCTNLISVSSDWNTGKASDMSRMFCNCPSLASLDVSNFDTSKVTTIAYMFWGCSSLDMIDVSSWDVGKVSNMQSMFENCSLISELDVSDWNVGSLTNMAYMLQNCSSLSKLNVANWKPNNVININNMFNNCKSLTTLDASNWNISKATSFANLFAGCTSLVRVNLSNWNTSSVTSLGGTFSGCTSLVEADLSNWNTSKNTNMATMFYNCTSLESIIGLDGFDTRSVSNMKNVFQNCQSLTTLDLSNFDTTNGNCGEIFRDCRNLSKIGMLYCNKKTVNDLITQIKSINTSLKKEIYLIDVEPSEMEVINNITYHKGVNHEEEILLPCQLMKVGNYKDRLYYDKDNGKYFIEKNVGKITTDELVSLGVSTDYHTNYVHNFVDPENIIMTQFRNSNLFISYDVIPVISTTLPSIHTHSDTRLGKEGVYTRHDNNLVVRIKCKKIHDKGIDFSSDTPPSAGVVNNAFKEWMIENPADFYYASVSPQLIEVKNLDKIIIPSSDENNLSTISVKSNDHIGATDINLKTNSIRYNPLGLSTNTLYTLQLDSIPSNVKTISANLGGTIKNIDMSTNSHSSVEITTPSTLTTDNLELIGEGIKVSNVMLFNGKPNQNPEYVDGIQSIGELQENGKYKIDIQTKTDALYEEEYEMTDKLVIEDTKDIGHVRVDKIIGNSFGDITDTGYSNGLSVGTRIDINHRYWFKGIRFKESKLNDKIYVKLNVTLHEINTTSTTPEICTRFSGGFNGTNIPLTSLPVGTPTQVSMYRRHDYDFTSTNGNYLMFGVVMNSEIPNDVPSGKSIASFTINDYVAYNLTEVFGSGNEPTQEWCDENLPYIEGLKSTFEEGLVTQDQVDNGQELEGNLDKYKASMKVVGRNIAKVTDGVSSARGVTFTAENGKVTLSGTSSTHVGYDLVSNTANSSLIGYAFTQGIKSFYADKKIVNEAGTYKILFDRFIASTALLNVCIVYDDCSKFNINLQSGNTIKVDKNINGLYISCLYGGNNFTGYSISNVHLEKVEDDTDEISYEPYHELTQSIYLNSPLLKGDEIVMKDGELCHYHKMGKVTLNGSENWNVHIQGTNCYSLSFAGASSSQSNALSNRMKVSTSYKTDSDSLVIEATRIIYTETKAGISPTEATYLKVPKLKAYLQENPLVIIYELAEPYYEPLNQNQINIDTPETRSYVSIDSLIPTQNANVTYLEYGICNNSIELDEPLRAIGNVRDKLYWDWYEGKYVLERSTSSINNLDIRYRETSSNLDNIIVESTNTYRVIYDIPTKVNGTKSVSCISIGDSDFIYDTYFNVNNSKDIDNGKVHFGFSPNNGVTTIIMRLPKSKFTRDSLKSYLIDEIEPIKTLIWDINKEVEYISLPKQNTKTYAPVTYLTMPNIPLKTDISIDTDIQKYRPNYLSANTKYTVFLDSVGDNDIKVELGGKVETITPSMEHGQNKVIITTPSTLSHNDLYVSGAGSNVKNVMLMQNEITQSPEYIDSIQSVGENVENEHLGTLVNLGEGNKYKNIFINEIHGDTYKGSSLGELIVDEFGDPVLDDNGDKQYTFKIKISNHPFGKGGRI